MTIFVLKLVFWSCIGAGVYHYAGYPIVLFVLAQVAQAKSDVLYLLHRRARRCTFAGDYVPRVALLVSAYNEEAVIAAKMANSLQLNYPRDRFEVLVGLDAPTDRTAEILAEVQSSELRVCHFEIRRGKLAVLHDLAQRTSAEIVVFTDANTM